MKYATYYKKGDMLGKAEYKELKKELLVKSGEDKVERYLLRKLQFISDPGQNSVPNYFLCQHRSEDQTTEEWYLEKKYVQSGIHYKKCVDLTKEQCRQIMGGDLEWMKNHKEKVLAEFYLQITLNHLSPGYMTEYQRERIQCTKDHKVIFSTSIRRAVGTKLSLFKEPEMFFRCLDEGKVHVSYRKTANLPEILLNVLQAPEESNETYSYAY